MKTKEKLLTAGRLLFPRAEDHRGHELQKGDKVAYNLSGEIAVGYILDIQPGIKNQKGLTVKKTKIKIENSYPILGHISIVTSPKNVLFIDEVNRNYCADLSENPAYGC